ncbi:MAG: alpha/beta hydrolase [Acidobacteria bacterium]|nr:alpha/beta hydrolase [Acidobacteriota bacterium]
MKVLWLLLVIVAAAVALKVVVTALEPGFVFFPYKGEDQTPASLGLPYQQIRLTTPDGEQLTAWQLEPERPKADIVYFHGNGGNLSLWLPVLATLHRLDYRVLAVDYRGYGRSTGSPTEQGVYRDAETTARHAQAGRVAGRPLVFWGRSLGAAIAAAATRVVTPDGLILEAGFPDKASVAWTQPVLGLLNVFASYRFDLVDLLRGFDRPVLVMHGEADRIVPFALGRRLFERLGGPKQFVAVPQADHNDFFDSGHKAYWEPAIRFIEALGR